MSSINSLLSQNSSSQTPLASPNEIIARTSTSENTYPYKSDENDDDTEEIVMEEGDVFAQQQNETSNTILHPPHLSGNLFQYATNGNQQVTPPLDIESQLEKPEPLKVASFVRKVYDIVNDDANKKFVSWSSKGPSFVVWNSADFSAKILPKHFKHGNFPSFVRQLNNYGFHKVESKEGEMFSNKYFRPNRPDLLRYIQRHKQFHSNIINNYSQSTKSVIKNDPNNFHILNQPSQQQQQFKRSATFRTHNSIKTTVKLWRKTKEIRAQNEKMLKTLRTMFADLESIKTNDDLVAETTEKIMDLAVSLAKTKGINCSSLYSKYLFHKSTLRALRGASNAFEAIAKSTEKSEDPLNILASAAQQQQQNN